MTEPSATCQTCSLPLIGRTRRARFCDARCRERHPERRARQAARYKEWYDRTMADPERRATKNQRSLESWRRVVRDDPEKRDRVRSNARAAYVRRTYGLSPDEHAAMLAAQGGGCAICGTDEPGGAGSWHTDHDHTSGDVRGLLCAGCNPGLGLFRDDPTILRAAADYLERHHARRVAV